MLKLFLKSFKLLDQGHVLFTFTCMEEEMLLAGERQTTNPFRFGAILVRFQNHIRKARLKSLTLSYFNHTVGRRFLPFGITAISIWL